MLILIFSRCQTGVHDLLGIVLRVHSIWLTRIVHSQVIILRLIILSSKIPLMMIVHVLYQLLLLIILVLVLWVP